jgi:RNA polymerase-interacting CarD/CdnL/TRCF family regulator
MAMSFQRLLPGDRVSHPMYGFGVVEGVTTFDQRGRTTDFYNIRLSQASMLTVPVDRAEALGLRRIVNGLATIAAWLRAPAHPLPDNDRARVIELKASWQAPQPAALAHAVRDLLGRGRTHRLTPNDKRWLADACERMSAEAALVDAIELFQARAAIQHEIELLKSAVA